MSFQLSKRDSHDVDSALDEDSLKAKIRRKLMALKMRGAGVPLDMVASSLGVTVRTVSNG